MTDISENRFAWIVLYSAMFIILFLRRPDSLLNAQPWAEDGPIFLQQAIEHSYFSILIPYAGYLHLIPRLATLFALQFGLKNAPFIMNLLAVLITIISASYIFSKDFKFLIKNDVVRFIAAIFIICMPTYEIFLNITNIQWPLSIYLILWTTNLIFGSGSTTAAKALLALLVFLTCAASVVLLPALAWYVYKSRSMSILAVFSIAALNVLSSGSHARLSLPDAINAIRFISAPSIFTNFFNSKLPKYGYEITYVIMIATLIILIYYARDYYARNDWHVDAWFGYLIVAFVLLISITRPIFINLVDGQTVLNIGVGSRYVFIPLCLLFIICIRHLNANNYLIYLILFIFAINIVSNYSIVQFPDLDFKSHAEKFNASGECNCTIPINPNGWSFTIPCITRDAYSWYVYGLVLDKQQKYDDAIKAYDKAIEINPQFAAAWNKKGNALKTVGRTAEANLAFNKAKGLGYKS